MNCGVVILFEQVEWIFECFYWIDLLWYGVVCNVGFGFVIVKLIMELYCGKVEVVSCDGCMMFVFYFLCGVDCQCVCCCVVWLVILYCVE